MLKKSKLLPKRRGAALLLSVFIIGSLGIATFGLLVQLGLASIVMQELEMEDFVARQRLYACKDETMAQLLHDPNFVGSTLSIRGEACEVGASQVSQTGREFYISTTEDQITRNMRFTYDSVLSNVVSFSEHPEAFSPQEVVTSYAYTCYQEVINNLDANPSYDPGGYYVEGVLCLIDITAQSYDRIVSLSVTDNGLNSELQFTYNTLSNLVTNFIQTP